MFQDSSQKRSQILSKPVASTTRNDTVTATHQFILQGTCTRGPTVLNLPISHRPAPFFSSPHELAMGFRYRLNQVGAALRNCFANLQTGLSVHRYLVRRSAGISLHQNLEIPTSSELTGLSPSQLAAHYNAPTGYHESCEGLLTSKRSPSSQQCILSHRSSTHLSSSPV